MTRRGSLPRVVVDLRALPLGEYVFDVERMPAETLAQGVDRLGIDGRVRWIQVRPLALSSATRGSGRGATASLYGRGLVRRMRGRLGIGTEWVVRRWHHVRHCTRDACEGIAVGREVEVRRNPPFEHRRVGGRQHADRCSCRPERERPVLENESADRRSDEEADLPRGARERHVAPKELRLGEVDYERGVDRPCKHSATAKTPTATPKTIAACVPVNQAPPTSTPRNAPPDDTHQGESAQAACPSTSFITGSCAIATPAEKTNQITLIAGRSRARCSWRTEGGAPHHGDAGADQDHVEDDEGDEDAIPCDIRVASGTLRLPMARRRHEFRHAMNTRKVMGVSRKRNVTRSVGGASDGAGDERAERETHVHRHPLLGEAA